MSNSVLFVDVQIKDYEALLAGLGSGVEIHLLNAEEDGVLQMADILKGRTGLDSIQILSHGSSGTLALGSGVLNGDNLGSYANALGQIGSSLSETGDILLYGCNVAKGETGLAFVDQFAALTGADVAASDDLTGNAALGGDWSLEVQTGPIESSSSISVEAQAAYDHTLFSYVSTLDTPGYATAIAVANNTAYIADRASGGLRVIDASNPTNPTEIGFYDTLGTAWDVAVANNIAYVADGNNGLQLFNVLDPHHPTLVGSGFIISDDVMGVTLAGNTAFVRFLNSLEIVDITDPNHLTSRGSIGYYNGFSSGSIRAVAVQDNTLFTCSQKLDGSGYRLQVIDVSTPSNPTLIANHDLSLRFGVPESITISNNTAFVSCRGDGLQLFDITTPSNPQLLGTGMAWNKASAIVGNTAIVAGGSDVNMLDISSLTNPKWLDAVTLNPVGSSGYAEDVSVSGHYAYVADGVDGLKIVDITDHPS